LRKHAKAEVAKAVDEKDAAAAASGIVTHMLRDQCSTIVQ